MKRPQPIWLLLALALLAGQWLSAAHAASHVSNQAEDALCAICVQVHNLEHAQHSSQTSIIVEQHALAPVQSEVLATLDATLPQTNIRAPPAS